MELHCLPSETPTTDSSCSTDPLYDNCLPFAQRGRAKEKEMENTVVCPTVTRLPGPCRPQPGLAPVVDEVPTQVRGGQGAGPWPDHSYCSWRGGFEPAGWEAELDAGMNRARAGDGGGEKGGSWGLHPSNSPNPSQSEEHRSALSLYDNLPEAASPESLQDAFNMETGFVEPAQEHIYRAWAPEQIQELMEDDKSTWSSCEIILPETALSNQEKHEQEPELASGSCGFRQTDLVSTSPHLTGSCLQTEGKVLLPTTAEPQSWSPRVPPPVPLADPSASALRSLLTSLQQQIGRQREEYEERIIGLEQRNEELQVEVVRLKTNLAQQRHWYHVVQAKIVESERARTRAELRNATLQKEMDQFFDTFGELNNEAKKTECIVKSF